MANNTERFVRWQGQTMAQLSVVLSLVGVLALGGLGLSFSLVQQLSFNPVGCYAIFFLVASFSFLVAALSSVAATITRLLDFRLTAKKVRNGAVEEPLTFFGTDASGYGKATWRLLWSTLLFLTLSVVLLVIVISHVYLGGLLRAAGL